jgi:hypothetical protein
MSQSTPTPTEPGPHRPLDSASQEPTTAITQGLAGTPRHAAWLGDAHCRGRELRMLLLGPGHPASRHPTPVNPSLELPARLSSTAPSFGCRARALAVNDCPACGPDPYLHSSAPGPARPPANLRPRHPPAGPGARTHAGLRFLKALESLRLASGGSLRTTLQGRKFASLHYGRAWV